MHAPLGSVSNSSSPTDVVRMHFGLKGDYRFSHRQLNRSFDLIGGHHNILFSNGFDMEVTNKTKEIETFGIQFTKDLFTRYAMSGNRQLEKFCENVLKGDAVILSPQWGAMNPAIEAVIAEVIANTYAEPLQELFLFSKAIELMVLCAESCTTAAGDKEVYIKTKQDKERLIAVRDLINQRLEAPPGLPEIARSVGLNEYKLKRGFREMFSYSVFGYLADQRLNLAKRYLLDTNQTAAEISGSLGYATPQHFNNAFRNKFMMTPMQMRKGR